MMPLFCLSVLLSAGCAGSGNLAGYYGWAQDVVGGEGGRTIRVTTLEADGPGSLRAALEAQGPRIIVFDVAGVIDLDMKMIHIREPFVTVAGETAPSPGVTLIRGGLAIRTHQVILRHLRIRPGEAGQAKASGWEMDGITTYGGARDVVIAHCSVSWATDENLSVSGPRFRGEDVASWRANTAHRVTVTHCIIAEGLSESTHAKVEHSKGTLIHDNVTDVALIANLYASNVDRNPLFKGGAAGVVVNNVIHNPALHGIRYLLVAHEWGDREHVAGRFALVGNVLQPGPDTRGELPLFAANNPCDVFARDNRVRRAGSYEPLERMQGPCTVLDEPAAWPPGLEPMPAEQVFDYVLDHVGARPWDRDAVDQRLIEEVRAGTGSIKHSENDAGGYPY